MLNLHLRCREKAMDARLAADVLSRGNPEGRADSSASLCRTSLAVLAQRHDLLRGLHPELASPQMQS
jgi:hypothetical protein